MQDEIDYINKVANDQIEDISEKIEEYEDEIERLDYESKDYDNLIEALEDEIEIYSKQIQDIERNKIEPLQDQIDIYDKQLKELDYLIEPLEDQIDAIDEKIEDIDRYNIEPLQDQIDAIDKQIDYIDRYQIEPLEDQVKANDKRVQALDDLIQPIQDQIDLYDDQIEYIDRYLIEPLQDAIDTYDKQLKAIDYKIEPIQDQIDAYDEEIAKYNDQIKLLDDQIEAIQDKIDINSDLQDKWEKIRTEADRMVAIAQGAAAAGMGGNAFKNTVLSGNDTGLYESTKASYESIARQQMDSSDMAEALGNVVSMLEQITEKYLKGDITSAKANELMTQIIKMAGDGFSGKEIFTAQLALEDKGSLSDMLATVKEAFSKTTTDFASSLKTAESNNKTIKSYTSEFSSFRSEILDHLDRIEEAYGNSASGDYEYSRRKVVDEDWDDSGASSGPGYEISSRASGGSSQAVATGGGNATVNNSSTTINNSSSSGPGAGISSSNGGGGVYYPSNFSHADGIKSGAIKKYATGLMQGAVGPSSDERVRLLQQLALGELKPAEVPSILDVGEVVLNPAQQMNLLGNIKGALSTQQGITNAAMRANMQKQEIKVTMGDIHVHDVDNGQEFARTIAMQFKSALAQELSRTTR